MSIGSRNHGHEGLIVEPAKYLTMIGGTASTIPAHPGLYPNNLAANPAAGTRAKEEAQHEE